MHHRRQLGTFLNERGLHGIGVLVGAGLDAFAREILRQWHCGKLYVVDPVATEPLSIDACVTHRGDLSPAGAGQQVSGSGDGRLEFLAESEPASAARFADGGADFVFLATHTDCARTRENLRLWYPKLRVGSVMAGHGFIDAVWQGVRYEAKAAVEEFAAEHRLLVRVTFDMPPTWHFLKPPPQRPNPSQDIALLTAHDQNQADLAQYSTPNKSTYCARHGYRFVERTDGFAPSRPAAWSKVRFIKECLRAHEWVFWSDADSLVMNASIRLEEFVNPDYDLTLAHDDFGQGVNNVNTGQMLFRRTKWSLRFLDEVWSQKQFIHDRLWENRAVIHLLWNRDLSRHVQIVSQRTFNSYPSNYRPGDFILHVAGMPHLERQRLMRHYHRIAEV